jgi:probable phosphoglycerate mutase
MKTKIIAVRHGETEWNKIEKQQGHLNSNLTELGKLQAKAIGDGLHKIKFDKFYTSDLGRAIETSEIISDLIKVDFITDMRLRERNLGRLQGLTKNEYKNKYPEDWMLFIRNDPDYILPDGESIKQRCERAINCIEELASQNMNSTVLIVSHGGILMSMVYKALKLPLNQKRTFSLYNGSINIFSISHTMEWNLEVWGDTHHLEKYGLETLDDN